MGSPNLVNEVILRKIYRKVPNVLKERAGEQVYDSYLKFRRKLLGARVGVYEGKRRITYFRIDRGHPETLLYFHGFADSKDTFYDACHFLSDRFNIIAPDLPGFGKSDKRKDDHYNLDNYANWMVDFIVNMGIDQCHLAGNSLGGAVAAAVALSIQKRFKTLTLIDPAGIYFEGKHSLHQELFDGNILFDVRNEDEFEYFLDRVFYRRPIMPPPVKDFFYKEFHRHSMWHRKVLSDLFQGLQSDDDPKLWDVALNHRLSEIHIPTLILWGDEDTLFPADTAYLVKNLIPNSRVHFFTDVGHCPQIESPRLFGRVLKKYIFDEVRKCEHKKHHDMQPSKESRKGRELAIKPELKVVAKKSGRGRNKPKSRENNLQQLKGGVEDTQISKDNKNKV